MPSYRTVQISELTPGSILATAIFDTHFAKLLDAGAAIDQHLIERLEAFNITEVMIESAAKNVVRRPKMPLPSGVQVRSKDAGARPTAAVDRCSCCGAIIALQPPTPNSKVSTWLCKTCGAVYFGSDDGGECQGVMRREFGTDDSFLAPVELNVEADASPVPPENVLRLIKSLVPGEYTGPDRRLHKRHPVMVPVTVLPLALNFRINGEPVQMMTANVSLGGAALIHTRFLNAPYLALDFTVAGVELLQVVLKVLRVQSTGPVDEIAGQFISRLSQANN